MKVIITSKNFNTSDRLKETVEKKFEKLGKYFSNEIVANVMLTSARGMDKVEATINANGTIFRAEESTGDVYSSIDRVVGKLSSQMSRFKTKLQRKHKGQKEFIFDEMPEFEDEDKYENESEIVKRKSFKLQPMSIDEATMQMELVEHDFFIFLNEETNSVNVVYKRKSDAYGLLEVE